MDMGFVGWIVVGFIAGSLSGWFVSSRNPRGCLATIVVGVLGGVIGGWLSRELGFGAVEGFVGAVVFATVGAVIVRLVLAALEGPARR
jgi:uncharacterized membrane protein YeaQ/YmgE (transglycosylase-associated protein family)